jgi:hypothetical protein
MFNDSLCPCDACREERGEDVTYYDEDGYEIEDDFVDGPGIEINLDLYLDQFRETYDEADTPFNARLNLIEDVINATYEQIDNPDAEFETLGWVDEIVSELMERFEQEDEATANE